jgi:4-hydroxy-2-oxoheptanedioate aldolase
MVETAEALDNLDDIVTTPGLDAIYIGPSDLAYAIGLNSPGDFENPKHIETVNLIYETCRKHGIAIGIHTGSLAYTQRYLEQGFNFVTLGTDSAFMGRMAGSELAQAKQTKEAEREKTGY